MPHVMEEGPRGFLYECRNSGKLNSQEREESVAVVTLLKACAKNKDIVRGRSVHADILHKGLLRKNTYIASALVNMYAKCGAFAQSKQVLDALEARTVAAWNALIAGYVQAGHSKAALICFERMQSEGLFPDAHTFSCILKACANIGSLEKGRSIHYEIAKQGLVSSNIILCNALVDMYAKCSALAKAKEVIEALPVRDVVSWNALIAGHVQQNYGWEAVDYFECMQDEGHCPDAVTFICVLKACGSIGALHKGGLIHSNIVRMKLLDHNVVLGGALVDMYVMCGALLKAKEVLEELPVRNVVCWSALIRGYTQEENGKEALNCFEQMEGEGLFPDVITFICILQVCGDIGALDKGKHVHLAIARQGFMDENIGLGNALVDMYARCGALAKAKEVLEELPVRDVSSWCTLISGYVQLGEGEEALNCYEQMQCEGVLPNIVTVICMLKACGAIGALGRGEELHSEILSQGLLEVDALLGNAIIDMYVKCGILGKAKEVLQNLPVRNVVSWSTLIAGYVQGEYCEEALEFYEVMLFEGLTPDAGSFACILKACGSIGALDSGKAIHSEIIRHDLLAKNVELSSALMDMYAKCGALKNAKEILEGIMFRNVIMWNALIAGCVQGEQAMEALDCFERMQSEGFFPDATTFACILKTYASIRFLEKGRYMHSEIIRQDLLCGNIVLGNALVDMYARCSALAEANEVLEGLPVRDVGSWNALITGYVQEECSEEALNCYEQMQWEGIYPDAVTFVCALKACGIKRAIEKGKIVNSEIEMMGLLRGNIVVGNALVDMYVKCGAFLRAKEVLEGVLVRDSVSWNVFISGYVHQEHAELALKCFDFMQLEGFLPDAVTFICLLKSCGSIGTLDRGKDIHSQIIRQGLLSENFVLGVALVDMYTKCGALVKAKEVLEGLPLRSVVLWNALLAGYAQRERGKEALCCLRQMEHEGICPDRVTFLSVLSACSHSGLLNEGLKCFAKMNVEYGIVPCSEHQTCMINLLGHVGLLDKAVEILKKTPSSTDVLVWVALLNVCKKWGNVTVGRWAFKQAVESGITNVQSDASMNEIDEVPTKVYTMCWS